MDKSHTQRNGLDFSRSMGGCHDFVTCGDDALMKAKKSEQAI